MSEIMTNPFEDKIDYLLRKIEENRLWAKRVGHPNSKPREILEAEYDSLILEYNNELSKVEQKKQLHYQKRLGRIMADFGETIKARSGFVEDLDVGYNQKYIESKLIELMSKYNSVKNSNGDLKELFYIDGMVEYYIEDLKNIPHANTFIENYIKEFDSIKGMIENKVDPFPNEGPILNNQNKNANTIDDENSLNQDNMSKPSIEDMLTFDKNAYNCSEFISSLNKCKNIDEVKKYIDSIVNSFQYPDNTPKMLGSSSSKLYLNNGIYDNFINPQIMICPEVMVSNGFRYHIYDNEYLYDFAVALRKMNLSKDANILPMVMKFLDSYFGFPKDTSDMREDTLYNWAVNNAERFLNEHNIPVSPEFNAIDQMQIKGDYPISAFKGAYSAQCTERGALAQNILKVCGLRSFVMFGECESRKESGGHCWNAIADSNNNLLLIDYSNTVYCYTNGQFTARNPYWAFINNHDLANQMNNNGFVEMRDFHYENGKQVYDSLSRKYAIGKSLNYVEDLTTGNKLK